MTFKYVCAGCEQSSIETPSFYGEYTALTDCSCKFCNSKFMNYKPKTNKRKLTLKERFQGYIEERER